MKLPAIRGKIGSWTFYVSMLSFEEVKALVQPINDQLHTSVTLREMIQRSITDNYISIEKYILTQKQRFFNALVLAVYDGTPKWIEVEMNFKEEEFFNLGFLEFSGEEKIFPVDGQHRVEGIKAAISANPKLKSEKIPVIFIGHKKDAEGMQKSRRLFSTLNRYAKPVTMDDIIALDEDDSIAIVTRELLETFDLFSKDRVVKGKQKAIQDRDKISITSIITLYQCNRELLKLFIRTYEPIKIRKKKSLKEYLKFRPEEDELGEFQNLCFQFWTNFRDKTDVIKTYLNKKVEPASDFRNKKSGGNLLFRPVGLLPFIQASVEINKRGQQNFEEIFTKFSTVNFELNKKPWRQVIWNPFENKMIMGNQALTKLLLLYLYDSKLLRPKETESLKNGYASAINFEGENVNDVLKEIK